MEDDDMKRSKFTQAVVNVICLTGIALSAQAALQNGDVLSIGEGSKIAIEATKGFWLDVPIKGDRGLIIGMTQSGNSIDQTFTLFGRKTHHMTSGPVNAISNTELDFSTWGLAWGDAVMDLGGGTAAVACEKTCSKGESFTLEYSTKLPAEAGELAGLPYRLQLSGKIK